MCKKVLQSGKIGHRYSLVSDTTATYVTFLGSVFNKEKEFKIITIRNVWGMNSHTNGYIWVYDTRNRYLGRYVLGDARDLPIKLVHNQLFFSNKDKGCDKIINSKINLRFGLPGKIFIPACNGMGDIYEFTE